MFGKKKVQQPTIPPTPIAGGQPAAAAQAPATANPAIASKKPPINAKTNESLKQGSVSVVDIIAPSSVEVDFKHIRVGETFYRTFFVVDYPRQVSPNWLSILIDYKFYIFFM